MCLETFIEIHPVVLLEMFQVEMVEIPQHWVYNPMVVEVEHIEMLLVMLLLDPLVQCTKKCFRA